MNFITIGALLAGLGVALNAYGAHRLADRTDSEGLVRWGKAVRLQLDHALGLIAIGILVQLPSFETGVGLQIAGGLFQGGIFLFCGGLYARVLSGKTWPARLTPVGGLMFIAGWLVLAVSVI